MANQKKKMSIVSSKALLKVLFSIVMALPLVLLMTHRSHAQASLTLTSHTGNLQWTQLTDKQKEVLSPLEPDWNSLTPERKQKWGQVANKFEKMSPTEQDRLQSRMKDWTKLSPDARRVARDHFLQSLTIPNDKKAEAWQAYQQLSPEEKQKLADQAASKKPSLVNSPSLK